LRQHAAAVARHPIPEFCDQLLDRMEPEHTDDIAILALRLPAPPRRLIRPA
jgi:hypothetical protein